MVTQTKTIRITQKSLRAFRRFFPAYKGETIVGYFDRLAIWLKEMDERDREAHGL